MAVKKLKLWFDEELAALLADKIMEVMPDFNSKSFKKKIKSGVQDLELKDRVELIADELFHNFNGDYDAGIKTMLNILGPENELETGMFTEFYWVMPIAKFIEKYGLENYTLSMQAIEEITKRNTGEYTIRPFIELKPKETIKQMKKWSKDTNSHVRRLSSEGLRPRLPWAKKLNMFVEDPSPIIPILNNLKDDQSKYVQKSVANCINDILKDNLQIGKQLINEWNTKDATKQRQWVIKHALRNLLKAEDKWAKGIVGKH